MTNLETIVAVRSAGFKPKAVHVHLVETIDRGMWPMNATGSVTCEVAASESLTELDLRPLRGLFVLTFDFADDRARHRRLAKLIAQQEPALLVMHDGETVHRRWPDRTESFAL